MRLRLRKQVWRVVRGGVVVVALALLFLAYHGKRVRKAVVKPSPATPATTFVTIDASGTTATSSSMVGINIEDYEREMENPRLAPNAPLPSNPPPAYIIVGPFRFHVLFRTKRTMPGAMGQTYPEGELILLRRDLGYGEMRETLLHEIEHACIFVGTGGDAYHAHDDDEFIEANAPILLTVLRDNPKLVRWWVRRPR